MECPRSWAALFFLIYFLIQINVYCQNVPLQERQISNQPSKSLSLTENPYTPNIQDDRLKTVNVITQAPTYYSQESTVYSQPAPNIPNMVVTSATSYTPPCSRSSQPIFVSESTPCNSYSRTSQVIPLDNYAGSVQSVPAVWRLSQPSKDVYNYAPVNPMTLSEIPSSPVNLQISPPSPVLPTINTQSGIVDILTEPNQATYQDQMVLTNGCEDGFPFNLQINVPSQNAPGPRITVVSGASLPVARTNSDPVLPFPQFGFPPPFPQYIRKKSRSCLKSLLPILLLALLNDQGSSGNSCCGNGCCCPCNCNCDRNSDNPIPIPYPIPIPMNNPIVNTGCSSYSSRKRGQRDYENDDDEDN